MYKVSRKAKTVLCGLLLLAGPMTCGQALWTQTALAGDTCGEVACSSEPPSPPSPVVTPTPTACDEHPSWCPTDSVSINPVLWLPVIGK